MCQTPEQNKTFENIKKGKSTDRWQESLSDTRERRLKLFFFFSLSLSFQLDFCSVTHSVFSCLCSGESREKERYQVRWVFIPHCCQRQQKKKLENSKRQRQICGRDDRKGDVGRKNVKAWDEKKEKSLAEQRGDTVNRRYRILKLGYGERSNFFLPRLKPRQFPRSYTHTQIIHTIWCFIAWNLN